MNIGKLSFFHLIIWVRYPFVHSTIQIFILNNLFCLFIFLWFFTIFYSFFDIDGYYIVRTNEGQPRPKYIFNKCGTNIYFFTLQRFGPSPSPNFKSIKVLWKKSYFFYQELFFRMPYLKPMLCLKKSIKENILEIGVHEKFQRKKFQKFSSLQYIVE